MSRPLNPLFVPPHKIYTYYGTPTGSAAATSYLAAWLCDAQSNRPYFGTSTSVTVGVNFAAGSKFINFVSLINSNVSVNGTVSGALSGTLTANPVPPDGVIMNPFLYNATGGTGSGVSVAISSNPNTVIIGELVAGEAFELERPIWPGGQRTLNANAAPREDDFDVMPSHDLNAKTFSLVGDTILTTTGLQQVRECYEAQRGFSLPVICVPEPTTRNEAFMGKLDVFEYTKQGPEEFHIRISFKGYAGIRWN